MHICTHVDIHNNLNCKWLSPLGGWGWWMDGWVAHARKHAHTTHPKYAHLMCECLSTLGGWVGMWVEKSPHYHKSSQRIEISQLVQDFILFLVI